MLEFKKRRRTVGAEIARMALGLLGVVLLALAAFGAARAAVDMYGKFSEAAAARAGAEVQLAELEARDTKIRADVAALATERGVEAALRERYGVVRPGEGQINIVRQPASSTALREEPNLWQNLWQLLFVW